MGDPFHAYLASIASVYEHLVAERNKLEAENQLLRENAFAVEPGAQNTVVISRSCLCGECDKLLQEEQNGQSAHLQPVAVRWGDGKAGATAAAAQAAVLQRGRRASGKPFSPALRALWEAEAPKKALHRAKTQPLESSWGSHLDPLSRKSTVAGRPQRQQLELKDVEHSGTAEGAFQKRTAAVPSDFVWEGNELEIWETADVHHEAVVSWSRKAFSAVRQWYFPAAAASSPEPCIGKPATAASRNWLRLVSSALATHDAKEYALRDCWDINHDDVKEGDNMDALRGGGITTVMEIWGCGEGSQRTSRLSLRLSGGRKQFLADTEGGSSSPSSSSCCSRWCGFRMRSFILHPLSVKRTTWVCLGLLLISYEAIMLSMEFFPLESDHFFEVAALLTTIYWSIDIPVSFLTGIFDKSGAVSMKLSFIAKTYMSSWFLLDVLLLVINWVLILIPKDSSTSTLTTVKMVRYTRFLRLMRLAKFERLMSPLLARINSTFVLLSIKSVILLVVVVLWVHLNGCFWFGVGRHTPDGWTAVMGVSELSVFQMYLISTHWAVAQLQGSIDIYAGTNLPERAYAVCYTFASIGVLAAFVSKLTNIMIELQDFKNQKDSETRVFIDILSQYKVSTELSLRVRNYLKWKQTVDQKREAETNSVLETLPVELRKALVCEMRTPHVVHHPIFGAIRTMHEKTFRRVCSDAMRSYAPIVGENMYSYGERCSTMYIVSGGDVTYRKYGVVAQVLLQNKRDQHALGDKRDKAGRKLLAEKDFCRKITVREGQWLCEAALWLRWVHRGDMLVPSQASLLLLDADSFANIVTEHLGTRQAIAMHAVRFAVALDSGSLLFLSDLFDTATAVNTLHVKPAVRPHIRNSSSNISIS